jgi:nicotinate-nucleotide adenylyltransferase
MERFQKKETIIYGGAFNPPTLAHQAILNAASEYAEVQNADIWIMLSGDRQDKTITTARDRRIEYGQAMARGVLSESVVPEVMTMELDRTEMVETYDTVKQLETEFPDRSFTFIFGADSTETMGEWQHGDKLLKELKMLVVEREGSTVNPLAKRAIAMTIHTMNVSSTQVRQRIADNVPVDDLVTSQVAELIYQ